MDHHTLVVVSGASSRLGHFLLPRLVAAGYQVVALSRQPPPAAESGALRWLRVDLTQPPATLPGAEASYLLHLARLPLLPVLLPRLPRLKRVVAFSSTSVFCKADSPDPAEQALAASLAAAEQALISHCQSQGVIWTLLRPTLIYGCGQDQNVSFIARFIERFGFFPLLGTARGLRQPVHADDLAQACLAVLDCEASYGKAYNLSGGETLSYRAMVTAIFQGLGRKPRWLPLPAPVLQMGFALLRVLPRYRHLSAAMLARMNQDLCFDHRLASRDFGYRPRGFAPDRASLGFKPEPVR